MTGSRRAALSGILGAAALTLATCSQPESASEPSPTLLAAPITTAVLAPVQPSSPTDPPSTTPVPSTAAPSTSASPPQPPETFPSVTPVPALADAACTAQVPIEVRVAQLVWPAVYGAELSSARTQLAGWGVGGAVVMTAPPAHIGSELADLKQAGTVPLLLATDEEGGRVQRFKALGAMPSPADVATTMTPDAARLLVAEHAAQLAAAGIDIVFAPVVDVQPVEGSGPIGDRSFGRDPAVVSAYAAAYVAGWTAAGVTPVLKHFPGHGDASGDTHEVLAATAPLEQLRTRDVVPYRDLAGRGAGVMVGHLVVPGLTEPGLPASLSPAAITGLLRNEYGYDDALVFTDALGMSAVLSTFSIPEAAELAIAAGADVVIYTATDQTPDVIHRLAEAAVTGRVAPERIDDALRRVLERKGLDPCTFAALAGSG